MSCLPLAVTDELQGEEPDIRLRERNEDEVLYGGSRSRGNVEGECISLTHKRVVSHLRWPPFPHTPHHRYQLVGGILHG